MQLVKIPTERIKHLLGKKSEIQKAGGVKMTTTSEGEVSISSEDAISEWKAADVVKAIGRGFRPDTAIKLFEEDYMLKVVNLKELFKNEKQRVRYKARVIGTRGKAKKTIEDVSGAVMSIYGSTVSILGKIEEVALAERAVSMLLSGASHGSVFYVLQKEQQRMIAGEDRRNED